MTSHGTAPSISFQDALLDDRYDHTKTSVLDLNSLQEEMVEQIRAKVTEGRYEFELHPCTYCGDVRFRCLAKTDRYGLFHPVALCRRCGLIQTNPRMTEESYATFYDEEYRPLYHGTRGDADEFFSQRRDRAEEIYEYFTTVLGDNLEGADVLDIGAGSGGMMDYFRSKGHRVCGCDLNRKYARYAQDKGLDLRICSMTDIDPDWTPDIVILSHVVEHLLAPIEQLERLAERCHGETMFYIEVPGVRYLEHAYRRDFLRMLQNAHTFYFSLDTLTRLLWSAGYERIAGSEQILSVFRPGESSETPTCDDVSAVDDILAYLRNMEESRMRPEAGRAALYDPEGPVDNGE